MTNLAQGHGRTDTDRGAEETTDMEDTEEAGRTAMVVTVEAGEEAPIATVPETLLLQRDTDTAIAIEVLEDTTHMVLTNVIRTLERKARFLSKWYT